MEKWYKELDKKFSWSFFGFLVGIIGLVFGFYTFYHKEKPNLQFEIVTNTDVFNLNENIGKLQILYNDENVLSIDTTLKLVTVKLINSGDASIKKEDFDKDYLVKLTFENFIIADKPNIIEYGNSYLKDRFSFTYDSTTIQINPIILDENDYVIFKILLIGARNEIVQMTSSGKIAGQENISVLTEIKNNDKRTIWYLLKVGFSAFLVLLATLVFGYIYDLLIHEISSSRKNRLLKRFISNYNIIIDKQYEQIFQFYRTYGVNILKYIVDLSRNSEKLEKVLVTNIHLKSLTYQDLKCIGIKLDSSLNLSAEFNKKSFIDELILNEDFLLRENNRTKFKDEFIQKVEKLITSLEN